MISFRVQNFRALRDEAEISLVVPNWVETEHVAGRIDGGSTEVRVGAVAGIFGSNASGKTTVLRAIWMMAQMVSDSHQRWKPSAKVPYAPFFAEPARSEPTVFDLDFIVDGERYQYGFKFDREKIREEWLYSFPKHRPRLIFERDSAREEEYRFGRVLRGSRS